MPAAHWQFWKPGIIIAVQQIISCTTYLVTSKTVGLVQDLSTLSAAPAKGQMCYKSSGTMTSFITALYPTHFPILHPDSAVNFTLEQRNSMGKAKGSLCHL